ncbi:hypothetical protein AVEN_119946-1, partial [Araneus ventricosus]
FEVHWSSKRQFNSELLLYGESTCLLKWLGRTTSRHPGTKEGCGKVAISLSIGRLRKDFRSNRFGNHCHKAYVGKLFMSYVIAFPDKPFPQNSRRKEFYEPPVPLCVATSGIV